MSIITQSLGGPGALTRKADPATSHEAADSLSVEALEDSEREVLAVLAVAVRPLTAEELYDAHLQRWDAELAARRYSPSRIRTALKQLVEDGRIEKAGTGRTISGRAADTWRAVQG